MYILDFRLSLTFFQRIHNWIDYRHRKAGGTLGTKKKEQYLNLTKKSNSRRESAPHAYNRLKKAELGAAFKTFTDNYASTFGKALDPKSLVGVRAKFIKDELEKETDEIKALVESMRLEAGDKGAARVVLQGTSLVGPKSHEQRTKDVMKLQG